MGLTLMCILCSMWDSLPFKARHTTPVHVTEAEAILITGYWVSSRADKSVVPQLCERHVDYLNKLDEQMNIAVKLPPTARLSKQVAPQPVNRFPKRQAVMAPQAPKVQVTGQMPGLTAQPTSPVIPPPSMQMLTPPAPPMNPPLTSVSMTEEPVQETAFNPENKPIFPCVMCGKATFSGDVHQCS